MAIEYFPNAPSERPRTRIKVDSSAISGSSSDSQKVVMLVGPANGGKPNTVYKVRNYVQAKEIFRGGELLDALEMAWNPGATSAGAGEILALRVEDATPATLVKGGLTFKTKLYGEEANGVSVALVEESLSGTTTKNLTVNFPVDGYNVTYRNLGHIFTVSFTGTEAYAGIEVTSSAVTLYKGASAEAAAPVVFSIGSGVYSDANVLVNAINSVKGFTATMPIAGDKNIATSGLDAMAKTEVTSDGLAITGLKADIAKQLAYDSYVEVEVGEGAVTAFELSALEGGTNGVAPESWATKLPLLANEGGYYLVPLTEKASIHAEALAFVNERTNNGEPMRVIAGAGHNETVNSLLSRASALRNARFTLVGFSGTRVAGTNQVKQLPAYMMASLVAGLASGLPIGEPLTFKTVNISSLSKIFEGTELDTLNNSGVVMAEFIRNRGSQTSFRIVDDVTTYNDRSNPVQNQMSVGEANDFLVGELKNELDNKFIGTRVVNTSASLIKSAVQSFLERKKKANEIQDYAPEEIQVVINGEVASISLVIYPIRGLKHIEVSLVYNQRDIIA